MIKRILVILMKGIFFQRWRAIFFCFIFMLISFAIEIVKDVPDFFSSSGTLFTVAGLFLNLKHTAIFHLEKSISDKYDLVDIPMRFTDGIEDWVKHKTVTNIEKDEVCGVLLMVFGTLLWGYGSYLISFVNSQLCK